MRLIDADKLMLVSMFEFWQDAGAITPIGENILGRFRDLVINAPTIESRHGLLLPDISLPSGGCYKCMFREGNLCRFLPASVPVVECAKRYERHKDCPLIEV